MEALANRREPRFLFAALLLGLLTTGSVEACPAIGVENDEALIPDSHMSASSEFSSSYVASNGRLNSRYSWEPGYSSTDGEYLAIDLGGVYNICAVATQGNGGPDGTGNDGYYQEWTTTYYLSYSVNTSGWIYVQEGGINKVFNGNNDTNTIVKNTLRKTVLARFIRFTPRGYYFWKALRVEVYGTKVSDIENVCENETCIYFTDQRNIRALDVESKTFKTVVPNVGGGSGVDVLVRENTVFWSDTSRSTIAKVNLTSGVVEDILSNVYAQGIAVDWMAKVIYWGDYNLETIEVAQLNGQNRKVLFSKDLSYPFDIVADPLAGYLFWSEYYDQKIYRSSLAGENRITVINLRLYGSQPRGMVIDFEKQVLYWLDYWNEHIEGVNYDGSGYQKHLSLNQGSYVYPAFITVLEDLFYWTDAYHGTIERVNRTSSPMKQLPNVFRTIRNIQGIAAFHLSRQPLGNNTACSVNNGNCSHLCLLSGTNGRKCLCPSGTFKKPDGLTCQDVTDFIIVTEPGYSTMRKIWIDGKFSPIGFNPYHAYNPIGVACDSANQRVFWTDDWREAVYVTDFNAATSREVVSNIRGYSRVAYDSVAGNLYITDDVSDKIVVANILGNDTQKKTLVNIKNPRSIALDLQLGYMYIASAPSAKNHTILKVDMDGNNVQELLKFGMSKPTGLVFDKANYRLYWAEEATKMIRYVNLNDVSNIITLQTLNFTVYNLDMTLLSNYLYVVESGDWYPYGNVYRVHTTTGQVTKIVENLLWPRGICSYSGTAPKPPTTGACSTNNGNCGDAICITKPNGKTCMCPDGKKLVGSRCEDFVDHIIFAETFAISKVFSEDSLSKTSLPLAYIDEPNALAYEEETKFIYWTDDYYNDVNRAKLDGSEQNQLVRNVKQPDSVALDTVARNMYFVDSANDHVEVSSMDGRYRNTLLTNISTPKSIALDLQNKYIYIASWSGLNHSIIRTDLDGQNFQTVAIMGNVRPNGLVLDSGADRLCWVEEETKKISCLSLSSSKVTKLADIPNAVALTSMALQGDFFWVTDRGSTSVKGSVFKCPKTPGTCTTFLTNQEKPRGIVANTTVYKGHSPCTENKGNCSHICVQSHQDQGYVCLCPNGMVKANDSDKTCVFKEFLMVVQTSYAGFGLFIRVPLNVKKPHLTAVPIVTRSPVAVDYDYQEQKVYWTDLYYGTISRAFLNGSNVEVIISGLTSPKGLAVDGRTRNLYFTDSTRNTLEVSRLDGSYRRKLFTVDKPYDIAMDSWNARIYFSSCGNRPSLESASMTGQERKIVHQWAAFSYHCPHGLHYDRATDRLYWTDGGLYAVYYITVTSKIITVLSHLPTLVSPIGMTMDENNFYITSNDYSVQEVYQVDKATGTKITTVYRAAYSQLGDLHVYKNITPPENLHPCSLGTSVCSYLCLAHQYGYRCECPNVPQVANCTSYDAINLPPTPPPPVDPCTPNPCMDGTCMEVNTTNGIDFVCNCSVGHSGRRCQLYKGKKPPVLYFANEKKISALALGSTNFSTVVSGLDLAVAVDVDVRGNTLYFSDWSAEIIYRKNLTSGNLEKIVTDGAVTVEGIALDWEACNIYWTDYIMETVEVASCDGKYRKVLFHEGVANARGIAVDPRKGYLFWCDWGVWKLERATLAGNDRKVIVNLVHYSTFSTNGLTIDYEKDMIYWIDSWKDEVWSCDYDGGFTKLVTQLNQLQNVYPYDLDLYNNILYWTEVANDQTIHRYNITTKKNLPNIYGNLGYVHGLVVDHHTRQPRGSQACAVNNGGCSQFCLLQPKGRQCACTIGFRLDDDEVSCLEVTEKLLLAEPGRLQIKKIIRDKEFSMATVPVTPKSTVYDPTAIAYDPLNKRIYWVDAIRHKIYGSFLNGSFAEELISGTEGAKELALDWSGNKLYWTSSAFNKIEVATLGVEKFRMTLIHENLTSPHGIVLDLSNRHIYFTSWLSTSYAIERSDMDGGNREVLAQVGFTKPTSLNLEISTNRLYWVEQTTKTIRFLNLSSPTYDVHTLLNFNKFAYQLRMAIDGPDVFVVDSGDSWFNFGGVYRCNKTMNGGCERVVEGLVDPSDIVAYNSADTPTPVNTECSSNNGGCQQLCLPKQNGYRCACSDKAVLNADQKTCKPLVDFLVFAQYGSGSLTKVYPEKKQFPVSLPIAYLVMPEAVAFDPVRSEIYWSDVYYEDLNRATLDGEQRVIARDAYAAGVAVDVATGNTYWTNSKHGSIEVASYNNSYRATLISPVIQPRCIALDHLNKYVYWGSLSHSNHKIERADMDGKNRKTVANIGNVSPEGLFLLEESDSICWVEHDKLRARCANPRGEISVLIGNLDDSIHPMDIAALAGLWYITNAQPGVIYECNKDKCKTFMTGLMSPKGIVSNSNVKTGENKCKDDNGGCSHICLQSRSPEGRTCECPTGMLHNGTNSCFYREFMLVASQSYYYSAIYKIPLTRNAQRTMIPIKAILQQVTSVFFDQQEGKVYWTQGVYRPGIYRALLNGSNVETVLSAKLIMPSSLVIDSIARNIYWVDTTANKIEVCSLNECARTRKMLLKRTKPRSVVIDTLNGYMFFSSCGTRSLVEKAWMDGTNIEVVKSWSAFSRHCISELSFDRIKNKLYWIDTKYNDVEEMDLNNNEIHKITTGARSPRALAQDETFLYLADGYQYSILKRYKNADTSAGRLADGISGMQDIHIFKNVTLTEDTHPCTDRSLSNCSDLCLLNPDGYHCACADFSVGCNSSTVKITTTAPPTTTPTPTPTTKTIPTPTQPSPCDDNPCESGGTCNDKGDGFECSCSEGYSGEYCHIFYGDNTVDMEMEMDIDEFNEAAFVEAMAESLNNYCQGENANCGSSSDEGAKRRRRSVNRPVAVQAKDIHVLRVSQKGKVVVVVFFVLLEAKDGQNKTVFEPKALNQAVAKSKDTFTAKFGVKIARIDGQSPAAIIAGTKTPEPDSKSGATAAIVIAVILVVIVLVVVIYLYMTRWRKKPRKLMRNESTRSIHDFQNPGYMAEESRGSHVQPYPMEMINTDTSFENPVYQMSGQTSAAAPVSSEPRPPMKKLPLHESLASPFDDGEGRDNLKKTSVDIDNNPTDASRNSTATLDIGDQK